MHIHTLTAATVPLKAIYAILTYTRHFDEETIEILTAIDHRESKYHFSNFVTTHSTRNMKRSICYLIPTPLYF